MKKNGSSAPATPTPVRSADIYRRLKSMILEGDLGPGQRLVERELARQMKVSRIPLRETLIRLESEGLVRSVANTATFVEDFSPQDFMEIYTLRLALEPLAARLAALRTTSDLVRTLRRICEKMTQLTVRREWRKLDQADYEFHHATVEASQHRRLIRAYEFSQIRILGRAGESAYLRDLPPETTALDHLKIVECIERGNGAEAEKQNYDHVEKSLLVFQATHGFVVQPTVGTPKAKDTSKN